jgi:lipoyl(octanoyl) transferase
MQLGVVDYAKAWQMQKRLAQARAEGQIPDTLVLLEHPHTYTVGRSGHDEHLLMGQAEREQKGVSFYHVDRGGDITYHGPGQLVGYPIIYLGRPGPDRRMPSADYVGYLRQIEAVLIRTLADWGICAARSEGYTGVWVDHGEPLKVAAIGVKVDGRGVTQHGFALNVKPDLGYFNGIVPCGIDDRGVTSMAQLLGEPVDLQVVAEAVAEHFGKQFGIAWRCTRSEELERIANLALGSLTSGTAAV